jgi:hypothetical protein
MRVGFLGGFVKKILSTLLFLGILTGLDSSPIHIMEHEDAHYDKAGDYGLRPDVDYKELFTYYDSSGSINQKADIIGAGVTAESRLNYRLSKLHVPNHPYTYINLYRFNNISKDGKEYDKLTNGEYRKDIENALKIEPLIFMAQLICNYFNSPVYFHSRHEIDRRGVVSYYSVSYRKGF